MKNVISSLIIKFIREKIKVGETFDAHTFIDYFRKNEKDNYEKFRGDKEEKNYHSEIAKIIKTFDNSDIDLEQMSNKNESKNINDNVSPNSLWKRIK